MTISKSLFSCKSDEYTTPKYLYDFLNDRFHFELDPCASLDRNSLLLINTPLRYNIKDDGLTKSWENYSTFVNPPYSKISKWIDKTIEEYEKRRANWDKYPNPIVLLIPARTDTKWFHKIMERPYVNLCLLKGRLQFDSSKKTNAPFPSCIIILASNVTMKYISWINVLGSPIPTWTLELKEDGK